MGFILRKPSQLRKVCLEMTADHSCQSLPEEEHHRRYDADSAKVDNTWEMSGSEEHKQRLTGRRNDAGQIYYLPYSDGKITSMRLPGTPQGVAKLFLTANMSGCRFVVDRVEGSNDVVVSHANTLVGRSAADDPVDAQTADASRSLDEMHATMVRQYANMGVTLTTVKTISKPEYYRAVQAKAASKRRKHYTNVTEYAGATVAGFYEHGSWEFHYQTWGRITYKRPHSLINLVKKSRDNISYAPTKVYDFQ